MKFVILALCIAAVAADPHWLFIPADEVALVHNSWDQVKHNEVEILYYVFKAYPDLQTRFAAFVGKDLESLKDTGKFALHAARIVSFFSEYIALLGKEATQPAIKTILNEMGYNHKNRGITKEQFNEFETALIAYLKTQVSWGDNVEKAWGDAFDKMYYVIFSNLDGKPVV
jgi:hemoglobin-like flavoprotein